MAVQSNINRLNGINPLSYMGVNPYTPPDLLIEQREPTDNDNEYQIGSLWLKQDPEKLWMLAQLIGGGAKWILLYPTSGSGASEFLTDTGNSATPVDGVLKVYGDSNIIQTDAPGEDDIVTVSLLNGTDGQIIIGGGSEPKWGNLQGVNVVTTSTGPNALSVGLTNGSNGQVVIGGGLAPQWANITSTDRSVIITEGPNSIDLKVEGSGNTISFSAVKNFPTNIPTASGQIRQTIVMNSELFDIGNNYNNSTGIFTAPITGVYNFFGQISVSATSNATILCQRLNVQLITTKKTYVGIAIPTAVGLVNYVGAAAGDNSGLSSNALHTCSININVPMDMGDTAQLALFCYVPGITQAATVLGSSSNFTETWELTYFGGYLLST